MRIGNQFYQVASLPKAAVSFNLSGMEGAGGGKAPVKLEIAGKSLKLFNGTKFSLGSSHQADDIVIAVPGIEAGHLAFFVRDGLIELCHFANRSWTTVIDQENQEEQTLATFGSSCTLAQNSKIIISLPHGKGIEIDLIYSDQVRPALKLYQQPEEEQLAQIEKHLRYQAIREFEQAQNPLQALSIYYEQMQMELEAENRRGEQWANFGNTAILTGLSIGTATFVSSLYEVLATSVAKSFLPFGIATSLITAVGIAAKVINPYRSPLRMMAIRDRIQCDLIECLARFSDREVAEVLSRFDDDLRPQLMDVIEKNTPMRYNAIGQELHQLLLASPEERPVLPSALKPRKE